MNFLKRAIFESGLKDIYANPCDYTAFLMTLCALFFWFFDYNHKGESLQ